VPNAAAVLVVFVEPAPLMTPADLVTVASSCLTAFCAEPPQEERALMKERERRDSELMKRRARRQRHGMPEESDDEAEQIAFGGPLWDLTVPIPAGILPRVFEYAQTHEVEVFGIRGKLAALKAEPEGWLVTVEASGYGRDGSLTGRLTYGSDREKAIATGAWTQCQFGKWHLTDPFPRLMGHPQGCDVRFGAEFVRPGMFERQIKTGLDRIEVRGNRARPFVSGTFRRLKTFLLPDVVLKEHPAGLLVESKP
jgi:hypothetical protein